MMAEAMDVEERVETLRSTAEEYVGGDDELRPLLHGNRSPICFHSFEPSSSGRVDIAQGVGKVINVNKMIRAGCRVKILIEDQRMGGGSSRIRAAGRRMIEVWKALGMDLDGVKFLWSSEETNKRAHEYWPLVMGIARENNVQRLASLHPDPDNVMVDQLWEPIMQCADILFFEPETNVRIVANVCPTMISVRKDSSLLGMVLIVMFSRDLLFLLNRTYVGMEELLVDYSTGALHPGDVKPALAKAINQILQPARDHFKKKSEAKVLCNAVKTVEQPR
ncbi:unnamed protein product [Alopecurus aequalis]